MTSETKDKRSRMSTINDLEMLGNGSMVADRFGTLWERTPTGWLAVPATTNRLLQTYGPLTVVFPDPVAPLVERGERADAVD